MATAAVRIAMSTAPKIGGTDYSDQVKDFSFEIIVDEKDITSFASGGWSESAGGIKKYTVTFSFIRAADMSGLDAYMWANIGKTVTWSGKGSTDATAPANALYSGSIVLNKWSPISGAVGSEETTQVTFTGTGAITRVTA